MYSFNDCCDANQFITAARCIRRGDVIYRDIYEVKGPILYLLYYIGTFLNENPFHGAYIIELISFSAYIFILYKTARLYLKSDILVIAAVSSAAYYSMITKTVFAGKDDIHTFIFDEIDSGISGQTAWKVSEKLAKLSRDHQILCITHLPQIAAMGDAHFRIIKETGDGRTRTHIRRLDPQESLTEVARLLGSDTITKAALDNAVQLKETAELAKDRLRRT